MNDRARLTIVDVVLAGATIVVLGFMLEPMYTMLNSNAGELGIGSGTLFRMVPAGLLMTLLIVIYTTAVGPDV